MIHIPQDRPRARSELVPARPLEVVRRHDPTIHIDHAGFDKRPRQELAAALADLNSPDIARPLVDVLE